MRPRWIVLVLFIVVLVSSCIQKPAVKPTDSTDKEFYYGYRPLPEEFLNYWFENLEKIKNGELNPIVFEGSADSKLIVNSSQIAQTQVVLFQPEIEVIPSNYLANHTSPKNQAYNGTCWAFTTAGSLESALLTQLSYSERLSLYPFLDLENPDLSEQFIAYYNVDYLMEQPFGGIRITCQETNQDIGGSTFFSTYNLIRRGVPSESDFPYITSEQVWIKWNAVNNDWKRKLVRSDKTAFIYNYQSFRNNNSSYEDYIKTIKSAIMKYGALAVSFQVYEDFGYYWWGTGSTYGKVYVHKTGGFNGGHAVLLVGWVDNYYDPISGYSGPIWVMKNSWGTDGGFSLYDYGLSSDETKGYFALPMISEDEYNNGTCPDWKIECSGMAVPLLRAAQQSYALQASDKLLTAGRIGYLDVKVQDEQGNPVPGVRVRFFARGSPYANWYPFKDFMTGREEIETDNNGIARMPILAFKTFDNYSFYAYVVENPSSDVYFTVSCSKPNWSFLVWMCADNDLEEYGIRDLQELKNVNENISVRVCFDGKSSQDGILILDEFGEWQFFPTAELDSGDPNKLLSYTLWYFDLYESSHRALILWDHGNAWVGDSKSLSTGYAPKAICFDDTSGNSISVAELRQALELYNSSGGPRIELLAMDACLMGSFEVLYELEGLVDYVLASSFSVPGDGYNYDFMKQITSTDNALSVGQKIVDSFRSYYDGSSQESKSLSLAVYDVNKVWTVASYLSLLGFRLVNIMNDTIRSTIFGFYPYMTQYYLDESGNPLNVLVDLNDCAILMNSINDSQVQTYAQYVQNALNELVVYEYVEKTGHIIDNPVSIFMPNNAVILYYLANDYNTLLFPGENCWSDFLETWLQTGDILEYVPMEAVSVREFSKEEIKDAFVEKIFSNDFKK
ncbi:MAG TPA: clostripain-related cysteine peptidase [Pseudothermotoga sp.]|nr:clostripain-related cysteine peptidase [Pseudothermotoga sp.]